jgi:hypothetical protein
MPQLEAGCEHEEHAEDLSLSFPLGENQNGTTAAEAFAWNRAATPLFRIAYHKRLLDPRRIILQLVGSICDNPWMNLLVLLLIVILILVALPTWPYSSSWGYYPSGGLGLVLIIVLILILIGRL